MNSNIKTYFASLRERWRDPMLTSLTVLLALLLFVLAPLQANGAISRMISAWRYLQLARLLYSSYPEIRSPLSRF